MALCSTEPAAVHEHATMLSPRTCRRALSPRLLDMRVREASSFRPGLTARVCRASCPARRSAGVSMSRRSRMCSPASRLAKLQLVAKANHHYLASWPDDDLLANVMAHLAGKAGVATHAGSSISSAAAARQSRFWIQLWQRALACARAGDTDPRRAEHRPAGHRDLEGQLGRVAGIDRYDGAGDAAAAFAHQELHRAGHVVRFREPLKRRCAGRSAVSCRYRDPPSSRSR